MSIFETLNNINVQEHVEQKNGLGYLSWAWAWAELKKKYPDANSKVYETAEGMIYWTDGRTAWVKTGVTIGGLEHIEYLPVMDYKNKSIPLDKITSTDVNKAIQRSITKSIARHGLGLYIYAGEDLPECERDEMDAETENRIRIKKEVIEGICANHHLTIEALCNANSLNWDEITEPDLDSLLRSFKAKGWDE